MVPDTTPLNTAQCSKVMVAEAVSWCQCLTTAVCTVLYIESHDSTGWCVDISDTELSCDWLAAVLTLTAATITAVHTGIQSSSVTLSL